MGLIAKSSGEERNYKLVPQGTHLAICNMVVDLGYHIEVWSGVESCKQKAYLRWEIPSQRIEYEKDGVKYEGPMTIGKEYTNSLNEKANLKRDLESWRGRAFTPTEEQGFDIFNVAGKPCQITITHKEGQNGPYASVTSVVGIPSGMEIKTNLENPVICFEMGDDQEKLRPWMKEKIAAKVDPVEWKRQQKEKQSSSYDQSPLQEEPPPHHEHPLDAELDNEIPF